MNQGVLVGGQASIAFDNGGGPAMCVGRDQDADFVGGGKTSTQSVEPILYVSVLRKGRIEVVDTALEFSAFSVLVIVLFHLVAGIRTLRLGRHTTAP